MTRKALILIALVALVGCDTDSLVEAVSNTTIEEPSTADNAANTAEAPTKAATPAPEPAKQPEKQRPTEPGTITLARATLGPMAHSMLLPEGFSRDRETATGAGYSYDLGSLRSIMVSLEAQGVTSARQARTYGPIVAGGLDVNEVTTMDNGHFLVTFNTRERDGMQAVAVFTSTHYVKCMGPEAHLDMLRQMCESLAPQGS